MTREPSKAERLIGDIALRLAVRDVRDDGGQTGVRSPSADGSIMSGTNDELDAIGAARTT